LVVNCRPTNDDFGSGYCDKRDRDESAAIVTVLWLADQGHLDSGISRRQQTGEDPD
jgi:hypothetical protein